MINPALAITSWLRLDTPLMTLTNGRVYAHAAPPTAVAPFVVVKNMEADPLVLGVHSIQVATVLVDCVGTPGVTSGCDDIADAVIEALATIPSSHEGVAFAGLDVVNSAFAYSPTDSPAVPRWVLTVTGTVRKS